jgi:hypothetical protein
MMKEEEKRKEDSIRGYGEGRVPSRSQLPAPGHCLPICPACVHYLADLAFHPVACSRVRWEGQRHMVPAIVVDGSTVWCSDFQAADAAVPEPQEA